MIIETLMNILYKVFSALTSFINIPSLPDAISGYMDTALGYIGSGVQILATFTHLQYLLVLFGIILAVDVGIGIYHFVMWILKKIPMLGVS